MMKPRLRRRGGLFSVGGVGQNQDRNPLASAPSGLSILQLKFILTKVSAWEDHAFMEHFQ